MNKIRKLISRTKGILLRIIYYKKINGAGKLIVNKKTKFIFGVKSKLIIYNRFTTNDNCIKNNGRSSMFRLDKNATINVLETSVYYGADIIVFENAKLTIGNSFINSDCKIRCHREITIGNDCAISHNFTVMDSDAHKLKVKVKIEPVIIGNHVWIGTRVTILPGVKIGDGAIIAAGAVVTQNIKSKELVAGVPARTIKTYVEWE